MAQSVDDGTATCAALPEEPGVTPISDEQLMLRYRDGDTDAFTPLYQRHRGALYRYQPTAAAIRPLPRNSFRTSGQA